MTPVIYALLGAVGGIALLWLASRIRGFRLPEWVVRLTGGVPWARIKRATYLGEAHGEHDIYPVSRHDLAECGLICPMCKAEVAKRADFSRVCRAMIGGIENEVIKCPGIRPSDDEPCPLWLAASPDTEHGDHLNDDGTIDSTGAGDTPEFFRFVRISAEKALQEKYGLDITANKQNDEQFNATPPGNMGVLLREDDKPIFLDPDPIDCSFIGGELHGKGTEVVKLLAGGGKMPWPDRVMLSAAGGCDIRLKAGGDAPHIDKKGLLVLESGTSYEFNIIEGARLVGSHFRQLAAQRPPAKEDT